MNWFEIINKEDTIKILYTFIDEATDAHIQLVQSYAKLDTTIPQENKVMYQAELSDIARHILDLSKSFASLRAAIKTQEALE